MEEQQPVLFAFNVDETAKMYLVSIAKWQRFMALTGIILSFIFIIALVAGGNYLLTAMLSRRFSGTVSTPYPYGTGSIIVTYVFMICIYLVPCFFMLSFANRMLKAITNTDQEMLNSSLKQLKTYSHYWGILTIIGIGFYALVFVVLIIAVLAGGMR